EFTGKIGCIPFCHGCFGFWEVVSFIKPLSSFHVQVTGILDFGCTFCDPELPVLGMRKRLTEYMPGFKSLYTMIEKCLGHSNTAGCNADPPVGKRFKRYLE